MLDCQFCKFTSADFASALFLINFAHLETFMCYISCEVSLQLLGNLQIKMSSKQWDAEMRSIYKLVSNNFDVVQSEKVDSLVSVSYCEKNINGKRTHEEKCRDIISKSVYFTHIREL